MSLGWKLKNIDDYVVFTASDDIVEGCNQRYQVYNRENEEWLNNHAPYQPKMPISGSFIYSQPPNYKGVPLLHADHEEWHRQFARLKKYGVDTVIYQASLWNELGTTFYPSRRFGNFRCFDCLDTVLHTAKEEGLTVFLGGYGSVAGWNTGKDEAFVQRELSNHFSCLEELFSLYGKCIDGIYFAPETAYRGERDLQAEQSLNQIYRAFCNHVKANYPQCPIMMSPGTKYYEGKAQEMIDSWHVLLDGVALDIMAPQDSVGCCGNTLAHQNETFAIWKKICVPAGIHLWSNVECFEEKDCLWDTPAIPATPERVACQMGQAEPYVEKLISWELLLYPNVQLFGERALALHDFLVKVGQKS